MRYYRWIFALSASIWFALSVGCTAMQEFSSSPAGADNAVHSASNGAEADQRVFDAWPMRDYVLDDTESVVLKVRPSAWSSLQRGLDTLGASALAPAPRWIDSHIGQQVRLEGLDAERTTYLMIESPGHTRWMACLDAGLPCPVLGSPPPLWGRLLVPAQPGRVEALATSLRSHLGSPDRFRLVPHESYVRLEFVISDQTDASWSNALDNRARYNPDPRGVRETPAKQAFMDHEGAAAVYGGLVQFHQIERYVESLVWFRSVRNSPPSQRWPLALTVDRGSFGELSTRQPSTDFEDLAVLVDGRGGTAGIRIDMVALRTQSGRAAVVEGAEPAFPTDEVRSLVGTLRNMTSGVPRDIAEEVANRVDELDDQGLVRRATSSQKEWAGLRLELGGETNGAVEPIEGPSQVVALRQPLRSCLAEGAAVVRSVLSGKLEDSSDFVRMANAVTAVSGQFERRMTECSGSDLMKQERIEWATAAFDLWRGLLVWRSGNREWSNRLVGRACQSGLTWACDVDRTTWPWVGARGPSRVSTESRR